MSSRFQPRGGIQTTFPSRAYVPTAADNALAVQQSAAYDACNKLIADVSLGDESKNEGAQLQLLAINVLFTAASLPVGSTAVGWVGLTDWTATLSAKKASLATFQ